MPEGYQSLDIDAVAEPSDPHAMLLAELAASSPATGPAAYSRVAST